MTEEQLPVPRQWVPGQQVSVHPDTAPWLQHPDGRLARLDTFPVFTHLAPGGCGGCREGWVAPDVDGPHGQGVRACPDCAELDGEFDPDPFESDLHAAAELAERLDPTGTSQVEALVRAVRDLTARLVGAVRADLPEGLVVGGDRHLVGQVLADPRLADLARLPRRELYDLPDREITLLERALRRGRAARVVLSEPANGAPSGGAGQVLHARLAR